MNNLTNLDSSEEYSSYLSESERSISGQTGNLSGYETTLIPTSEKDSGYEFDLTSSIKEEVKSFPIEKKVTVSIPKEISNLNESVELVEHIQRTNFGNLKLLGIGHTKTVYLSKLNRTIFEEIFHAKSKPDGLTKDLAIGQITIPSSVAQELESLKIQKQLQGLGALKLYGCINVNETYYIISKVANGGDLGKKLKNEVENKDTIAKRLLEIGSKMEELGIIHHDIWADNFLIHKGRVYVNDFGYAHNVNENKVPRTSAVNSLIAPPEMFKSGEHEDEIWNSNKYDNWAFGLLLIHLYRGIDRYNLPWSRSNLKGEKQRNLIIESVSQDSFFEGIPEHILPTVKGLLEIDPDQRLSIKKALDILNK